MRHWEPQANRILHLGGHRRLPKSPVHSVVISLIDRGQNNTCVFLSVETSKAMPVNRMLDFSLLKVPILWMKSLVNKTKAIQGCMYFLEVLLDIQYLKNEIGI